MKFQTPFYRDVETREFPHGKSAVERNGYRSAKQQIEALIFAGKRLEQYRAHAYEFGADDKVPDDYIDPTRRPNFDLSDATAMQRAAIHGMNVARRMNAEAKAEAEKEASEDVRESGEATIAPE